MSIKRTEDLIDVMFKNEFPNDRSIASTMDRMKWWRVNVVERKLYVPPINAIRSSWGYLDTFISAVQGFIVADLDNFPTWDDTTYYEDHGFEDQALEILEKVHLGGLQNIYVSCDIETRHVQFLNNKVLCIGFCFNETEAYIISVFTPKVIDKLHSLFAEETIKWILHNGKFDARICSYILGIDVRIDEDTLLLHYSSVNSRKGTHGLKELGVFYCYAPKWDDELDNIKKRECARRKIKLADFTYDLFPRNVLIKYLHFDVIVTRRLFFTLKKLARPNAATLYGKLIEASNIYRKVECNGVYVDLDYLDDLAVELEREIAQAGVHVEREVSRVWDPFEYMRDSGAKSLPKFFNMKSPQQLLWLLNTVLKTSGYEIENTKAETLERLFEDVGDRHPVISSIRDLRRLSKWYDTYVQGYQTQLAEDGRIHCDYKLHGTETGRLSSSDPNMQNIPRNKRIKNLFVSEPGKVFLQLDYSQAELRVLAYLSRDRFLTNVYKTGQDLHDAVAIQMFGPEFTKEQRVLAKTINFGIAYGRGPAAIASKFKIPFSEAKELVNNWFRQMPEVDAWIKEQRAKVNVGAECVTELGRERHFVITEENMYHVKNEYVNTPIQSLASDMTMFSLIEIQKWIEEKGLDDRAKIIINVHDSIIIELDDGDPELLQEVARSSINIMQEVPARWLKNDLEVPFVADAEIGYKWGEMKSYDPWIVEEVNTQ